MGPPWSADVYRDDTIDDENYHMREVYAHFGVAAYMAQVLEHGTVNLLAITRVMSLASSQEEYDELVGARFRKPLGELAKELKKVSLDDEQFLSDLDSAIGKRNYLIHRFWRERIRLTFTIRGRNRLIEELSGLHESFTEIDKRIDALTFSYSQALGGVDRQQVEQLIRDLRDEATSLDGYLPDELPDLARPADSGDQQ